MASLTAPGRAGGVEMLAFSPDGRTLGGVVGEAADRSSPQVVVLWDIASRRESRALAGHTSRIYDLTFAPDGRTLATGGEDATVRTWDITDGRETGKFETNPGAIQSIA